MAIEAGAEQARGIGARLRAARERKGYTLLQAAEKLHVDARVLESLESEDFVALGADVYVRGHLRRYADLTGESASELPQLYADRNRQAPPDLTRIPRAEAPPRSSRVMLPVLLVVVGCAVAGAVWWIHSVPGQRARAPAAPDAAPVVAPVVAPVSSAGTVTPAAPVAPKAAPGASGEAAPPRAAADPAGSAVDAGNPQADEPADVPGAGVGEAPGRAAGMSGSADAGVARAEARLELVLAAPSWVQVTDASGRRLVAGLIAGGQVRTLAGTPPLRIVLGKAAAVTLRVNGRAVPLAGLAQQDGSARFAVDGTGAATAAPRATPGE